MIIQNQKTMELFSQYQPLFAEAINSNRIGVCKWIESGTTIDTALPELSNLTDDKNAWRAVIVRYEDDNSMADFESDPRNPYDFLVNREHSNPVAESPVPLVRLTQMLGGVPPLEKSFRPEIIRDPHKAPRTIYVPVEDKEQEAAHQKLVEKYRYDGKLPSALLLITVRRSTVREEGIGSAWISHKESDSSEFWKRNRFPSMCRFVAVDFVSQGPVQRAADEFAFWYSVMLMTTNEWDSSTIQAYRLYSMSVDIDKKAMAEAFQQLSDRLRDTRRGLELSIRRDIENKVNTEESLPDYRLNVTVSPKLPKADDYLARPKSFGLFSSGAASDVAVWSKQKATAEKAFVCAVRTAERSLDQTADRMRLVCTYDANEVRPLNRYQEEDLDREADELYAQIVAIQGGLPKGDVAANQEVVEAAQRVKENLLGRVMRGAAFSALGIAAVLLFLSALPALLESLEQNGQNIEILGAVFLGCVVLAGLGALIALLLQKAELNRLIGAYNQYIHGAFNKLVEDVDDYSRYMSSIASHTRGRSYLALSRRKQHHSEQEHSSKYRHIKAINILLGKLAAWSKAFQLEVDFTSPRSEVRLDVDTTIAPLENKAYLFDSQTTYPVAVNNSGMTMESPYGFAREIEIIREELYENG